MAADRRDLLTFDRWDHWGLRGILWLLSLGAVAAGFVVPVVQWVTDRALITTVRTDVSAADLTRGATVTNPVSVPVAVAEPSVSERLWAAAPHALTALLVVIVARLLLRLLADLRGGDVFLDRNVRRLEVIAFLIGFGAVAVGLVDAFATMALAPAVNGQSGTSTFVWEITLYPWLTTMFIVGAIAQAFRHGARLRADAEGLV